MAHTMAKRPRSSDLLPVMNRSVAFYLLVTLCFIGCHTVRIDKPYELMLANCGATDVTLPCKFTHTTSNVTPPITQWRMLDTDEVVGSINSSWILNPGANYTDRIGLISTTDQSDSSIYITDLIQTTDINQIDVHVFSCEVDIAADTDSPRKKHIVVIIDKESVLEVYAVLGISIQCAGIVLDVLVIFFAFIPLQRPCDAEILAVNLVGICLCVTGIVLSALYLAQESSCVLQYQDIFCWAGLALGAVGFLLGLVAAIVLLFLLGRATKPTDKPIASTDLTGHSNGRAENTSESRESLGYVVPSHTKM